MQLGIFAKTFSGSTPNEVMRAAAAAGYATVQYNMACSGLTAMPDEMTVEDALAVARAATENRIGCAAVSGTYNMIHPDVAVRATGLRRLAVLAEKCGTMGTSVITLCTGTRDAADQWRHHDDNNSAAAWRDLVIEMEKAVAFADRFDVTLAIEPELANVVNSAAKAKQLLGEMNSPRLKIVLDAANLFEREGHVEQLRIVSHAIELLGQDIVIAHAKDRLSDGEFVAAGKGVLDYDHYFACLNACGFDGPLITHGLSALEASPVSEFLSAKLAALSV